VYIKPINFHEIVKKSSYYSVLLIYETSSLRHTVRPIAALVTLQ